MKLTIALLVVMTFVALLWLTGRYLRHSGKSFSHASRVWTELNEVAERLINSDIPVSVSRLVLALMLFAGCGCFVRSMLASHYLPGSWFKPVRKNGQITSSWDRAFTEATALSYELQEDFNRFIAYVILYDSYRHPLTGLLFRRLIRSLPRPDFSARVEAQLTAWSVVSRRGARFHAPSIA